MKCINIKITKEALWLSSKKVEFYLFISLKKEYTVRTGVVKTHFLEKKIIIIKAIVIHTYFQ